MRRSSGFSKYDRKETTQSIYCYDGTDVLINKENIRDAKALAKYEADITMIRLYQIEEKQFVSGRFGMAHLKNIHKFIFQDIYPFAGKFRTENIIKGKTEFCKSEFIVDNLNSLFDELKKNRCLKGLNQDDFSQKVAYYMSELNMIHPFREGNGRSTREFVRQLALSCGFIINWSLVGKETLLEAIIKAVNKDLILLAECINNVIEYKAS